MLFVRIAEALEDDLKRSSWDGAEVSGEEAYRAALSSMVRVIHEALKERKRL